MDYPKSKFEVIVVDNGCIDDTKEMVKTLFNKVLLICEKRKGASFARNTGSKRAKGSIIAYTDDDCIVETDWLKNLISGFISEEIGGVGGPVFHLNPELMPEKLWCYRTSPLDLGNRKRYVEFLITGNLAIRSELFKKIKFDESLVFHSSEDIDFTRSITESGYKLLYVPNAKVYHDIDQSRSSFRYIFIRAFFAGISFYILEKKRSKALLFPKFLRFFIGSIFSFFTGLKVLNFYWLIQCFIALICSLFLAFFGKLE